MKEVRRGARVLVEKSGIPTVGIISAEDFQKLATERETRFEVVARTRRRLPAISEETVERDVRSALREARLAAARRKEALRLRGVLSANEAVALRRRAAAVRDAWRRSSRTHRS